MWERFWEQHAEEMARCLGEDDNADEDGSDDVEFEDLRALTAEWERACAESKDVPGP